jgi:hypothetical protein
MRVRGYIRCRQRIRPINFDHVGSTLVLRHVKSMYLEGSSIIKFIRKVDGFQDVL